MKNGNENSRRPAIRISPEVQRCFELIRNQENVKQALTFLETEEDRRVKEQIEISEIAASPFQEEPRAKDLAKRLDDLGLDNVHLDQVGNVIGRLSGSGPGPKLVVSAHLDTVFPPGYDPKVTVDENGVLHGPGISDDAAGLAVLLSLVRAFRQYEIKPVGDIWFVCTVGEEGLGDLRGVKHLFATHDDIDGFITIDGGKVADIKYRSLGSKRYEVVFSGIGGHSFGAFGDVANPVHAMGRAISKIAQLEVPKDPKTTFSVSVVEGGTSVNAIAQKATMLTDTRSEDAGQLEATVARLLDDVFLAVEEENRAWGLSAEDEGSVSVESKLIGDRPCGWCSSNAVHVQAAYQATLTMGIEPELGAPNSTDASIPISLGIPALALGRGGVAKNVHTLDESFDPAGSYDAAQRALLLILGLAGLDRIVGPLLPDKK